MAGRKVGKGRGAVFASDGVRYDEGAEVPRDVEVGEHVFTDVDEDSDVGNPAAPLPQIVTAEDEEAPARRARKQSG